MVFCHNCGAKIKENSNYCGECGTSTKKSTKDIQKKTKSHNKSNFSLNKILTYLVVLFFIYLGLNLWALGQLEINTSAESVFSSISSFNYKTSLSSSEVGTKLRLNNPTFVPVMATQLKYELAYGERIIGEGNSDFVFIMPDSYSDVTFNFRVSHIEAVGSIFDGISDLFSGKTRSLQMNFFAGYGPIKIPVGVVK